MPANTHTQLLLVEDSPADADLIKDLFAERDKSVEVTHVVDGYEALDYVFKRNQFKNSAIRPDIIMLDLGMPRISGYEVLRTIKKDASTAAIPVIIFTTSCNPLDRSQCHELGADVFLTKPFNLKGYEAMVERLSNQLLPLLTA